MFDTSGIFINCIASETVAMNYTWEFHVKCIVHFILWFAQILAFSLYVLILDFFRDVKKNWFSNAIIVLEVYR